MHTFSRLAISAVALSGGLLMAAPALAQDSAAAPCPYPFDNCPTAPPTTPPSAPPTTPIGGGDEVPATGEEPTDVETPPAAIDGGGGGAASVDDSPVREVAVNGATLPFTGGEVTLLALAGTAALGGGAVLVAAGRRRITT